MRFCLTGLGGIIVNIIDIKFGLDRLERNGFIRTVAFHRPSSIGAAYPEIDLDTIMINQHVGLQTW